MPEPKLKRLSYGLLRAFTDVRDGEATVAVLMFANVFLILCAYYFIKPLREGWISVSEISGLGRWEVKAYSSLGQSLLLIFVVQWYSKLSDRWSRARLINRATLFCMSNMVFFWAVQPGLFIDHLPVSGVVFYLWVGMFGVFVVAQFWAFAADVYSDEQGRRLIPMVAIGATAGAAAGSALTDALMGVIGTEHLLLAALVPLTASMAITRSVDARSAPSTPAQPVPEEAPPESAPAGSGRSGLSIVLGSRFLLAVALITLLLNWVNTNGENLLFRVLQAALTDDAAAAGVSGEEAVLAFRRDGTTAFYASLFFWVNVVALALQAFVASRLLKYGGFAAILLILPVIALGSYTTMALLPVLGIVKLMKIAENSTDYSLNNTARHVLWLPVTAEMKYKGKPTIDALFARIGDSFAALTVLVGVQVFALATETYFVFNVSLVLVWLALCFVVIREHRRVSEEAGIDASA